MSRQITENAVRAFLLGDNFNQSNTEVHADCTGVYMFLFGNMIAVRVGNRLQITTAGWNTLTTRERLNGLPNQLHSAKENYISTAKSGTVS